MKKKEELMKTKEEILSQTYICAKDIKALFPTLGKSNCDNLIKVMQEEMREKGYFIPTSRPKVVHIKIFKKKFNL